MKKAIYKRRTGDVVQHSVPNINRTTIINTVDDDLHFLAECLPHKDVHDIKKTLNLNSGNVEKTLQDLLGETEEELEEDINFDNDFIDEVGILCDVFPFLDVSALETALKKHQNDINQTIEYLLEKKNNPISTDSIAAASSASNIKIPIILNDRRSATNDASTIGEQEGSYKIKIPPINFASYMDHRKSAADFAKARAEQFQKAARAYKKGPYGRAIAAYYAQEGRSLTTKMDLENSMAVSALMSKQSPESNNTVDLHYMTVSESVKVVEQELLKWKKRNEEAVMIGGPKRQLTIVTGKGSYRLFDQVCSYLKKHHYRYETGVGFVTVKFI